MFFKIKLKPLIISEVFAIFLSTSNLRNRVRALLVSILGYREVTSPVIR